MIKVIGLGFGLAVAVCSTVVISGCSGQTSVTKADGTQITHSHVAPGTKITTANGACIDSTGAGDCQQQQ